jgi:phenylacetate-coenzyme A ligase PaaK-like adenylate-forming protein
MFLEQWIEDKVRQAYEEDPECHRYIAKGDLTEITRQEIEDFQLFKLRKTLGYAYEKSAFYRDLFRNAGIDPDGVRSVSDLAKIPLTESSELAQSPYKFLCISLAGVARIFTLTTSGTSGAPKKLFFSEKDAEGIIERMGALMETILLCGGLSPSGCVVNMFLPNGSPMSQGKLLGEAVKRMGGIPVLGDYTASIEEQVRAVERANPAVLLGSVSPIYRITQQAKQSHNLTKMGVRIIVLTSEYLSKSMRQRLQDYWNAEVYHHYGMTELGLISGVECQAHDGFHFSEADFLFEIVDPATGEVLTNGEEGELVITTLRREGMPLIRYKTGDLCSLISTPCPCGASIRRISKVNKRMGSIVRVGEEELYPALFDEALYEMDDIIDYRLFLTKERLTCKVAVTAERPALQQEIAQAILSIPPLRKGVAAGLLPQPQVEFVGLEMLKREGGSRKQRIQDNRSMPSGQL